MLGIDDGEMFADTDPQSVARDAALDYRRPADQYRRRQLFVHRNLHGAQNSFVLAFGINDAAAFRSDLAGRCKDGLHQRAAVIYELLQMLLVGIEIRDRPSGHAGFHRSLGDGRSNLCDQPRIEGLWNKVFRTEGQIFDTLVGGGDDFALFLAREHGYGVYRGDLHCASDRRSADIESSAKNKGKAQNIVDLIRVVASARGDDGIAAHGPRLRGEDFRRWIGERQNQRFGRHSFHHLRFQHAAGRQAQEHVGAADDVVQGARIGCFRVAGFLRIHEFLAPGIDDSGEIAQPNVFLREAQIEQQLDTAQRGGAGAAHHQFDAPDTLADHLQAVQEGSGNDDGGAVLVVMEY